MVSCISSASSSLVQTTWGYQTVSAGNMAAATPSMSAWVKSRHATSKTGTADTSGRYTGQSWAVIKKP